MLRKDAIANGDQRERARGRRNKRQGGPEASEQSAALWARLMGRVDEVYCACEELFGTFRKTVETLVKEDGVMRSVEVPPFKDPVRLVAKAQELYSTRFDDGGLPEACVTDVARARVKCASGVQAHALLQRMCKQTQVTKASRCIAIGVLE